MPRQLRPYTQKRRWSSGSPKWRSAFPVGFRIVVILVVVVGSILTLAQGRYGLDNWIDLHLGRGARQRLRADRPGLHDGLRHPAHDQLRPRRDLHGRRLRRLLHGRRPGSLGFLNARPAAILSSIVIMCVAAIVAVIAIASSSSASPTGRSGTRRGWCPLISAIGASFVLQYTCRGLFGPGIYAYPAIAFLSRRSTDSPGLPGIRSGSTCS